MAPVGPGAVGVVIVAAGAGTRLGAAVPKAFTTVWGRTLLEHAVAGAARAASVGEIVVVAPDALVDRALSLATAALAGSGVAIPLAVVPGGAERTDSVAAGMRALSAAVGTVLVHDAARCLTPPALFDRVAAAVCEGADAVVPGLPVVDTLKVVEAGDGGDGPERVVSTPQRAVLRAVQTPQGFRRSALDAAHARGEGATDDAALVEAEGGRVVVVPGAPEAVKVTLPRDLLDAAARVGRELGPVLIVLGGLPGVGKSTVAAQLERAVGAVRVRVDTVEAALRRSGEWGPEPGGGVAGYGVAMALAAEHLAAGRCVVADTVNPVAETRAAWRQVGEGARAVVVEVSVVCTDAVVHEGRLAERRRTGGGVPGQPEPTWAEVQARRPEPWPTPFVVDTAVTAPHEASEAVQRWVLDVAGWAP